MSAILLKLTRYSISEISNDYSFTSQQNFSRAFKRYFKVTPEFYRKSKFWDFRYYRPQHKVFDFKKINCQLIYLSKIDCLIIILMILSFLIFLFLLTLSQILQ